jgi:hypothetical protein
MTYDRQSAKRLTFLPTAAAISIVIYCLYRFPPPVALPLAVYLAWLVLTPAPTAARLIGFCLFVFLDRL